MDPFDGRTAVVTGAASGIGRGLVRAFAERGARLVLADIHPGRLAEFEAELVDAGHEAVAVLCDVRDPDAVAAVADVADERFGGTHLLCNNAGVAIYGLLAEHSLDDWHFVMDVDFWGVVHGVQAFVPRMIAQHDSGHIVNTASMAGLVGMAGLGIYSAAKFAVVGLSEALRRELKPHNIGVSVLCPMMIGTPLNANSIHIREGMPGEPPTEMLEAEDVGGPGGLAGDVLGVDHVVEHTLLAIERNDRYILTHPDQREILDQRASRLWDAGAGL